MCLQFTAMLFALMKRCIETAYMKINIFKWVNYFMCELGIFSQ